MAKEIQTSAQMREFLAHCLVGAKNGDLSLDKASAIVKLAAQMHESLYSEAKVGQVQIALGRGSGVPEIGSLSLTIKA